MEVGVEGVASGGPVEWPPRAADMAPLQQRC